MRSFRTIDFMKFFLLVSIVVASPVNLIPDARLLFGRYAGAAKCDSIYEKKEWNCGQICQGTLVRNTALVYAKIDDNIDGAVQVTRNDELKLIVVAFRSTKTFNNLLQDLKFWKSSPDWKFICGETEDCHAERTNEDNHVWTEEDLEKSYMVPLTTIESLNKTGLPINVHVHAGFEDQYSNLRDINPIIKIEADNHPDYQIVCTGHSLGGAMAHLSAADLNDLYGLGDRISVYSFGQPRVGDQGWAEFLASLPFGTRIFRFAIRGDPIVQLPPRLLGYRHSRSQWPVALDGTVGVCPYNPGKFESEQCIWKITENNPAMHKLYDFGGECETVE